MAALRQDAWNEHDDAMLASITIKQIEEGGTQLSAFAEAATRIGRTAAACGFRWNSYVRKKYEEEIQKAKQKRQQRQSASLLCDTGEGEEGAYRQSLLPLDQLFRELRKWRVVHEREGRLKRQLERTLREKEVELEQLRAQNKQLQQQLESAKQDYHFMNDDYKALVQIMERARKLAFVGDTDLDARVKFRMDENGNLERLDA